MNIVNRVIQIGRLTKNLHVACLLSYNQNWKHRFLSFRLILIRRSK